MVRRTFYNIIGSLVVLCSLWSCQNEVEQDYNRTNDNVMTLNMVTRAGDTEYGIDDYNENKISSADVFFFSSQDGQCVYAHTGIVPSEGSKLKVRLGEEITNNTQYYVYVVANCNLGYTSDNAKGIYLSNLKSQTITTGWKDGLTNINDVIEESLIMDGGALLKVDKGNSYTIELQRAMAKVAVFPTAESSIVVGEGESRVTYTPVYDRMNVTFVNGVKSTNLSGNYAVQEADYIVRMKRNFSEISENIYSNVPFYSYPNPASTENRKESYLILCLPWSMQGQGSQQALNYYYRVPIVGNNAPAELLRNKYYKVNVHVGVLGSLDPKDAVELEATFTILDWKTMKIDTEMQNYQYLVLDEYYSVMNNVNELKMPYISSSNIDWTKTKITKVTYYDYSDETPKLVTLEGDEKIESNGFNLQDGNNNTLVFSHNLSSDDFVPYNIEVEVWNKHKIKTKVWNIIQYPAIYIQNKYNANGRNNRFIYGESKDTDSRDVKDDTGSGIGSVLDLSNSSDQNPNQYIIHITSFDIGDNYVIGDPRTEEIDELLNGSRKRFESLNFYYPARKEGVARMVAPTFMVASSWAGSSGVSNYENAKARCAAYQENGYPAGRWRMPTEAEIDYVMYLSEQGKIPELLMDNSNYWASSGRIINQNEWHDPGNVSGNRFIRCVYDVWYWGDKQIDKPNVFTWGDEERK